MTEPERPDDETKKSQPEAADEVSAPDAKEKVAADDESETKAATDDDEAEAEAETDEEAEAAARERRRKRREARGRESRKPAAGGGARVVLVGALALAAGGVAGWFGHITHVKNRIRAESTPAAAGSGVAAGPCVAWQKQLCASGGEESALCQQARAASEILVPSTCEAALESVPATLAKVKLDRAPCEQLVNKLCADLPPGSGACTMVKEKTPAFPSARCGEMLKDYDKVLEGVKQIDKQLGGKPPPPQGQPRVGMPHAAPGAPPHP